MCNIKLVCKRTCLSKNNISRSTWVKNKIYDGERNDTAYGITNYHLVNDDGDRVYIDVKFYEKYFTTIEEYRNEKINNILKKDNNDT